MLVFWKQRLVLLAVPKTGTTALEGALLPHASAAILDPPGQKHLSAMGYRNRLAKFFEQRGRNPMELVAVMREPVEWLGSWYRYRSRLQIAGKATSTQGVSFDTFVDAWLRADQPDFAQIGSQAKFLTDDRGKVAVDRIYRHDRIADLVAFLEDRLNTPLDVPRANVSPAGETALSTAMRDRLHEEAAAEFTLWNSLSG
ncbi:MAG: gamma-glutamyl kinase [Rhodobacteraceae bacterium CG17_big_fil_post_rev_8_21_14_2_50_65_11]|nr:MAG: gamma-glutamyl kinase [Rhodobacteraceae bacterium CG17_big_fil_post_rev_8_21_14_2_50_65_11]